MKTEPRFRPRRASRWLALALLASTLPLHARTAPDDAAQGSFNLERSRTYPADSVQARQVLDWVRTISPAYPSRLPVAGEVRITRARRGIAPAAAQAASSSLEPQPLPTHGMEGERYEVRNSFPDGTSESWTYEWRGDGWHLTDSTFHEGADRESRGSPNQAH